MTEVTFDAALANRLGREGMDRAERAQRVQAWKDDANRFLLYLHTKARGITFSADDLIEAVGLPDIGPNRNNVIGAWFNAMAKAGRIENTGKRRKSTRPEGHGRRIDVWRVL